MNTHTPAKKKRQAAPWQVVTGFLHFQRQLLFLLQEVIQKNIKLLSHQELASTEAANCRWVIKIGTKLHKIGGIQNQNKYEFRNSTSERQ